MASVIAKWKTSQLIEKMSSISYSVDEELMVKITHIENPENFYVFPACYEGYLSILEAANHEYTVKRTELYLGSILVFESKTLGHLARGEINYIDDDNECYTMLAIDYGVMEKNVSLEQLKKPRYGAGVPQLAKPCKLARCKPKGGGQWTESSIEAFKYYVASRNGCAQLYVTGVEQEKLVVELRNGLPDDLATLMALTEYSTMGYDHNKVSMLTSTSAQKVALAYKQVQPGVTFRVRVLSGKSLQEFYVAEVNDYKEYIREKADFKNDMRHTKQLSVEEFKVGTAVAIYTDWVDYERAIITEIVETETRATVQLLDWGTTKQVRISDMKPLDEYYCTKPAKAIYCSTEDSQIWDNGLPKFLFPGYEFQITVVKTGHGFKTPSLVNLTRIKGA